MNPSSSQPETPAELGADQRGATALEWTLLLGAIAIPSYVLIALGLATLAGHYRLVGVLNALPFP